MTWCKHLVILLLLVSLCLAQEGEEQETGRRKAIRYKHKYHLHHKHIWYWLAFLAIKVKIVFLIGTWITFVMFATKFFALIKYGTYYLGQQKKAEPEKVYLQPEAHPTYYSAPAHDHHFAIPEHDHFSAPDHDHHFSAPEIYDPHDSHDHEYGRDLGDSIFEHVDLFKSIIKSLDLTDLAFDSMHMKTDCRKRFVCESDYRSKNSSLLALGMYMFSDEGLNKYRTEEPVEAFDDCAKLFGSCENMPEDLNTLPM